MSLEIKKILWIDLYNFLKVEGWFAQISLDSALATWYLRPIPSDIFFPKVVFQAVALIWTSNWFLHSTSLVFLWFPLLSGRSHTGRRSSLFLLALIFFLSEEHPFPLLFTQVHCSRVCVSVGVKMPVFHPPAPSVCLFEWGGPLKSAHDNDKLLVVFLILLTYSFPIVSSSIVRIISTSAVACPLEQDRSLVLWMASLECWQTPLPLQVAHVGSGVIGCRFSSW